MLRAGSTLGQPWVNPPQASDGLYAIAALFRVSSGVGLCARVSLRGPSRRRRSRESARERARARPSPRTSIQKNSYPLSFLRFRVLLVARATPEAPPEAGSGAEKRRFNAPHLARPRVARAAARRSNDARFDARLFFFSRDASATTAPSRARVAECRGALARVRGARHEVETPRRNVTWRHDEEDAREKVFATPTTRGGERARRGGPKFRAARANRARARSRRGRPSDMCARGCESSREALRGAGARREQARSRNLARGGRDRGEGHIASTWTRWRGAPEARESSETRVHAMVLHRLRVRERSRARDMRPLRAGNAATRGRRVDL